MGTAVCCTRRSPDLNIDEVPPDQIGREISQLSVENPSSIGSVRSPGVNGDDVERQRVGALGPSAADAAPAGGRHWAKLRQSFHDGMGGRRSALKQLRRSQSRLSANSTTTGRSNHTSGPWGGSEAAAGRLGVGPRIPADRRSSGGSDGPASIGSRIDAIYEDDRYVRSSEAVNLESTETGGYWFQLLVSRWRQPHRAWSALRCFVVVISSTTLLLLVTAPDEDLDGLVQALAIMTTVSASILSALAKAPAEWSSSPESLEWKDYMEKPVSEKSDRTVGSTEFQQSASNSNPLFRSEGADGRPHSRKRVGSETESASGDSGMAYRGRRTQDDDNFVGTRFSGEAEIIDYPPALRTPTSPGPRMHAIARSASQTSLGLALAIKQQRAVLDSVAVQLEEAEEEVLMRGQMEEEQHELLRNFRRIVSRDVGLVLDPPNAHIFVVAKADQSRAALSNICDEAKIKYRAFASIGGAKAAVTEVVGQANRSSLQRSSSRALQAPGHDFRAHCFTRSFNRLAQDAVTIILLSAEWLIDGEERREVPREWHSEGVFIAVTCSEEELCQISNLYVEDIPNPSDFEILEALRAEQGINEVLTLPASAEDLRNTVMEALHQSFSEDYLLLQQVGRGSFASVHKAKRMSDGQLFALKEVHLRRLGPSGMDMVEQEAKLLRSLQWPTMLFLVDTWVHDGTRYFLTPLLAGGDIAGKCEAASKGPDNIPMDACRAFNWYVQTLHAISYMHWRGVLHTDLKPHNLLLGGNSLLVQVADLGSALLLPGPPPHPALKNTVKADIRTRLYTSPETMDTLTHSYASDLWSIGATYYEVFTLKTVATANMNASIMLEELKKSANPEALLKNLAADGTFVGLPPTKVEELKKQLVDLLSLSPQRRSSCISLLMQPILHQCLRNVLLEVGAFGDKNSESLHEQDLQEMLTSAAAAKHREPPFQDSASSASSKQAGGRDRL